MTRFSHATAGNLIAAGDTMQSSASRVLGWARAWAEDVPCPYEVRMAMVELGDAIDDWTGGRANGAR